MWRLHKTIPKFLKLILLTGLVLIPVSQVSATFPGTNGRIVFISDRSGDFQIHTMNLDGTDIRQLTDNSNPFFIDPFNPSAEPFPRWSPDGTKIVFSAIPLDNENELSDVYVLNADGSNLTNLTSSALAPDHEPNWSPDGNKIVFLSNGDGPDQAHEVYIMNSDGTEVDQITNIPMFRSGPAWSRDGTKIVFEGDLDTNGDITDIFTINVDGSNLINLTNSTSWGDDDPNWSPDGTKLVFTRVGATDELSGVREINIMNADGSGIETLTPENVDVSDYYSPAWSPDGTRIVFGTGDIYTMNTNGENALNITNNARADFAPDWQPIFSHTGTATLIVIKRVINNNGGFAVPSDFSFQVSGSTTTQPIISFNVNGQNNLTLPAGTYSVIESVVNGYSTTYSGCSNIELSPGGQATCTITNDDLPTNQLPSLSRPKQFDGATSISEGEIIRHPYISSFSADISDPDDDQIQLQVELRRFEEPFTNIDDSGLLTSNFHDSGETVSVPEMQLSCGCRLPVQLSDGEYHWRARVVDLNGNKSEWQEFGANGNFDFKILTSTPLEADWTVPQTATMGENYQITLKITNENNTARQAIFNLEQSVFSKSHEFSWESSEVTVVSLNGQPYQLGTIVPVLIPANTSSLFVFTLNNKWNWIEPWNTQRFWKIVESLLSSIANLQTQSSQTSATKLASSYDKQVSSISFQYRGLVNEDLQTLATTVEVPFLKEVTFIESVVEGTVAGKLTGAGFSAVFSGIGTAAAPWLFLGEAAVLAGAEMTYSIAADPQPDFSELSVVKPIVFPKSCIPSTTNPVFLEIENLYGNYLGHLQALAETYIKLDAAEDASDQQMVILHLSLIQRYSAEIKIITDRLSILNQGIISEIPIPSESQTTTIREEINFKGLPSVERCILQSLGFSESEVEETKTAMVEAPQDFFINFPHVPTSLTLLGNSLVESSQNETLPENTLIATIDFDPNVIHQKSIGKWVTAYITLPEEQSAVGVNCGSVKTIHGIIPDKCESDGKTLKFSRAKIISALRDGTNVVPLSGTLDNGLFFGGTDVVRKK